MKINEILSESVQPEHIDMTAREVITHSNNILQRIAAEYSEYQVASRSQRSAPDTSKFLTTVSGTLSVGPQAVHDGMFSRTFQSFLKIGTGIALDVQAEIQRSYTEEFSEIFGIDLGRRTYICSDGISFFYDTVSGTSWGGIGLCFQTK